MSVESINNKIFRQNTEALGYIRLAIDSENEQNKENMKQAAIAALEKITDDDIDELYDYDYKECKYCSHKNMNCKCNMDG